MIKFLITILFVSISATSCVKPTVKRHIKEEPAFSTEYVSTEIKIIENEYFRLSNENNIVFNNKVSIGFSTIDRERVIGTCTYGKSFREIDLDSAYWDSSSWESKVALVYHELTHCYCGRDHDFDDGTMYPDNSLKSILQRWMAKQPFSPLQPPGYLPDSCPKSIMHPIILDNDCFIKHYKYYIKEMFARCVPF